MNGVTRFEEKVKLDDSLEIVPNDSWWTLIVRHKESGRRANISYNSLDVNHWYAITDETRTMGISNALKFDDNVVLNYLKG